MALVSLLNPYGEGAQLGIFNSEVTGLPYLFQRFDLRLCIKRLHCRTCFVDFIGLSIYNDGTYLYPSYTIDYGQTFCLSLARI